MDYSLKSKIRKRDITAQKTSLQKTGNSGDVINRRPRSDL